MNFKSSLFPVVTLPLLGILVFIDIVLHVRLDSKINNIETNLGIAIDGKINNIETGLNNKINTRINNEINNIKAINRNANNRNSTITDDCSDMIKITGNIGPGVRIECRRQ